MPKLDRGPHWDQVYSTKRPEEVSWFEDAPEASLRLMEAAGLTATTCVLDVGGGESRLVDHLIARGLRCLAVLDVSAAALQRVQHRLGPAGLVVTWLATDVTADWSLEAMDIWHDRAVFHFLVNGDDRARYLAHLRQTLKVQGTAIIATFAADGPERCSGLPVARYSPSALAHELGPDFTLVESVAHQHATPWGALQSFQYSRFLRLR